MIARRSSGLAANRAAALAGHRRDVAAGAEPAPGAGEHDDAHRRVVGQRPRELVAERDDVLEVERVQLVGPVQRDGDDAPGTVIVALDVDAHAAFVLAASTSAKICSGPSGVFVAFTPSGRSASSTALATAACAPIAPPSPMPL